MKGSESDIEFLDYSIAHTVVFLKKHFKNANLTEEQSYARFYQHIVVSTLLFQRTMGVEVGNYSSVGSILAHAGENANPIIREILRSIQRVNKDPAWAPTDVYEDLVSYAACHLEIPGLSVTGEMLGLKRNEIESLEFFIPALTLFMNRNLTARDTGRDTTKYKFLGELLLNLIVGGVSPVFRGRGLDESQVRVAVHALMEYVARWWKEILVELELQEYPDGPTGTGTASAGDGTETNDQQKQIDCAAGGAFHGSGAGGDSPDDADPGQGAGGEAGTAGHGREGEGPGDRHGG